MIAKYYFSPVIEVGAIQTKCAQQHTQNDILFSYWRIYSPNIPLRCKKPKLSIYQLPIKAKVGVIHSPPTLLLIT
ncbi:hypothetical protein NIES1031_06355 [Chroogloeocystis siderophila 5.2 s.c.1]|jgi:hypothetical protein|uniref:Uncharacterized protein n=1 Tax=Chroogloeocystis siderophila 5.2 s.c.1 TaxID=247279 RepID=A0A1U7HX96_9CHRO|nr:hypothetical protein NIES1031_06355 [Chroogloeocystis siderophila 5.2 s.c.1]